MITIQLKLFATLNRFMPGTDLPGYPKEKQIPAGTSLADLVSELGIPDEEVKLCYVNGRYQELDYILQDKDEVGIFPPIGGGSLMTEITLDVWLYGELSRFGKEFNQKSFANLPVKLPVGGVMSDLLSYLEMPTEARGITFINGDLSAMPGLQPDLAHELKDGDRIAFFDHHSMWPFQYRHGAAMIEEMAEEMNKRDDLGISHAYDK